jgi:steroid 5-alpha reductase family enzyme
MQEVTKTSLIRNIVCLGTTAVLVFVLSQYSLKVSNLPLIGVLAVLAFVMHWIAFIPAYVYQTEKFYDLTGSITYLSVIFLALHLSETTDRRSLLVGLLIIIWTLRLGLFLFMRIQKDGKDTRFDEIKPVFARFFTAWTLSGMWVFLTALAAVIVITSENKVALDGFAFVGLAIWICGFLVESIADYQKRIFRKNPKNTGKFIKTGLWKYSRHPNYFGEIVLWTGIFIIALPVLQGWQWLAGLSPVFVYILLTKVSGINMLEEIADKRWGGEKEYEEYKKNTSVLILRPSK